MEKPQLVVLTKMDITEVRERVEGVLPLFEGRGYRVFPISAVTGAGVPELVAAVGKSWRNAVVAVRRRRPKRLNCDTP